MQFGLKAPQTQVKLPRVKREKILKEYWYLSHKWKDEQPNHRKHWCAVERASGELKLGSQTLPASFSIALLSWLHSLDIEHSLTSSTQVWYLVGLPTGEDQFSKCPQGQTLIGSGAHLWMNQGWLTITFLEWTKWGGGLSRSWGRSWVDKPIAAQSTSTSKRIYYSQRAWASICSRDLLIGWPDVLVLSGQSFFYTCCLDAIINSTLFTFKTVLLYGR